MYNYSYGQNIVPEATMPSTQINYLNKTTTNAEPSPIPESPLTPKPPYVHMEETISDIVELYHNEIKNLNMYQLLPALVPNMEEEEIITSIINHTKNNILYLEQIYLGLTGDTIDKLPMPKQQFPKLTYKELLKNTLFSKTDTLEQYETVYRIIPIQPYKDILFEILMSQLKDATSSNYLISIQTQL